jgi:hypothetical protein
MYRKNASPGIGQSGEFQHIPVPSMMKSPSLGYRKWKRHSVGCRGDTRHSPEWFSRPFSFTGKADSLHERGLAFI